MGNIVRIGAIKKGDLLSINTEGSQPVPGTKSYSLPLKISNLNSGIKYISVPKNNSDKLLVLDNMGKVINKSGYLADYKTSPILSKVVRDKLTAMRIESDRIKSAVEHGPIYDRLFKDLKQFNTPIEADVYLSPIKHFRQEYNCNPKFKEETIAFAESQGAKLMMISPNSINNNDNYSDDQFPLQFSYPQKGTIFAPNGEVWSWASSTDTDATNPTYVKNVYPKYGTESEDIHMPHQFNESLNSNDSFDDIPPLPNYSTHPNGMSMRDVAGLNIQAIPGDLRNVVSYGKNTMDPNNKVFESQYNTLDSITESVGNMAVNEPDENYDVNKPIMCQRCQRPIKYGEIAVKAERAGENASWHPQCFTCINCNQLLADLVYFYHKGEIYCARDLAEALEVLRCAACDELIFSRPYTIAEGKTFHTNHFCCFRCDGPLGGKKYVPDDKSGLPICLECYDKFHAAKCHSCESVIAPNEQGVSWSSFHWHGTCFNCACQDCGKSLLGGRFTFKNDLPFCSPACVKKTLV